MPVSDKEHFEALRAADQRAVELLAAASAARVSNGLVFGSIIVAIISVLIAVATIVFHH